MGGGKRLGGWRGEPHVHVVVVVVRHGRRRLAGSPEWRGQGGGRDRGRRSAVWLGGEARPRFFLLTYVSRMALVRPRAADTNLRVGGRSLARSVRRLRFSSPSKLERFLPTRNGQYFCHFQTFNTSLLASRILD